MENASKALIIAGSVLLSILIIALGVSIFNNARDNANTDSLDAAEINMFNQQFEKFTTGGNDVLIGSQVKSLLSAAISNASTNKEEAMKLPTIKCTPTTGASEITADGGTAASEDNNQPYINSISNMRNAIGSRTEYTVTTGYAETGLVNNITIAPPEP